MDEKEPTNTTFDPKAGAEFYRKELKSLASQVRIFGEDINSYLYTGYDVNKREMIVNADLSYRHLEDAIMRLGKVIQAFDGGVSIYDK